MTKPLPPKHHFIHAISSFYISNGKKKKNNLPTYLEDIRISQLINIILQFQLFAVSLIWHPLCDGFTSSRRHRGTWKVQRKRKLWNLPFMSHWVELSPTCIIHYLEKATNWLVLNRNLESLTGKGNEICIWEKTFCLDKNHNPKCLITPAWKRSVMLIFHLPHSLRSNSWLNL